MKEENKLSMNDYGNSIYLWKNSDREEFHKPRDGNNQLGLELRITEQYNYYCTSQLG